MEKIVRPFKSQPIDPEFLDEPIEKALRESTLEMEKNYDYSKLNIDMFPKDTPPPAKEVEWVNDKTTFKRGRIKVVRNKKQTKYEVTGLTKVEFNKIKELL